MVLSRPNGSSRLGANNPCVSRADGGEGAWGMVSIGAVELQSLLWMDGLAAIPVHRADGPSTRGPSCLAWGGDCTADMGHR